MYAMWAFLSVLSLYLFWRAIHSRQGRWWALFALTGVLSLYTHLFALLPLGVMGFFGVWLLLRRHRCVSAPQGCASAPQRCASAPQRCASAPKGWTDGVQFRGWLGLV